MAEQAGPIEVIFSGEQTIRTVATSAGLLKQRLEEADDITLNCGGIEEVDVTFIQMLLAARKTATARSKALRLAAPAGGALLAGLEAAGLLPGGRADHRDAFDFWMTEGEE